MERIELIIEQLEAEDRYTCIPFTAIYGLRPKKEVIILIEKQPGIKRTLIIPEQHLVTEGYKGHPLTKKWIEIKGVCCCTENKKVFVGPEE